MPQQIPSIARIQPSHWLAGIWLLFCAGPLAAQWNFLGGPLISDAGITQQSLAISPEWHPYIAFTSGGKVEIRRYDGHEWEPMPVSGLPTDGINGCALAFSTTEEPYLALAPAIGAYSYDSLGWHSLQLPSTSSSAQGLQFRISHAGALWISWFEAGPTDSTFVYELVPGGNWTQVGKLQGRVRDMELDDVGKPLLLLDNATSLLHFIGNNWQPMVPFSTPNESYSSLAMSYDGTSTSAMVMRRDSSNGLTVELLSLGNWVQLGTAGFATGDLADLGLSHSGTPDLVAVDHVNNAPPRAYQYVAGNWQFLGGQAVYNNTVSHPQLAFDASATFIAFSDDEQTFRNSVMYLGIPSAVEPVAEKPTVQLWPNPAGTQIHWTGETPIRQGRISILNMNGQLLQEQEISGSSSASLDVSQLPNGYYFVRMQVEQRQPIMGSFSKQN